MFLFSSQSITEVTGYIPKQHSNGYDKLKKPIVLYSLLYQGKRKATWVIDDAACVLCSNSALWLGLTNTFYAIFSYFSFEDCFE